MTSKIRCFITLLSVALASAGAAQDLRLDPPIDCELGKTCYIQNYVDADPLEGEQDFTCNSLTYNTHKGTDFGLPYRSDISKDVPVLAAADGVVLGVRDGERDGLFLTQPDAITNKECGNGLVLDHGAGWHTQYCHLKLGSVAVTRGQTVEAGDLLGFVGMSGKAAFPHVHFAVRHKGKVVDPFNADGNITCSLEADDTLWKAPIRYIPAALLGGGFSAEVPGFEDVKSGVALAETLPKDASALVVWAYFYGGRQGDVVELTIDGPQNFKFNHRALIKKTQALAYRAAGKRRRDSLWPVGLYNGSLSLIRDGEIISKYKTQITVMP